jgi:hypothetical protein
LRLSAGSISDMLDPTRLPPACIAVLIHCTMSSHPCSLSGKSLHFSLSSVEYHRISFFISFRYSEISVTSQSLRGLSPHLNDYTMFFVL